MNSDGRRVNLLTYVQAAEQLAVSKRTVERLVADGELGVTIVRGARRVHPDEIDRFVERSSAREAGGTSAGSRSRGRPRRVSSFRDQLRSVA